jgi:methyl-accepting chemotaxis protein
MTRAAVAELGESCEQISRLVDAIAAFAQHTQLLAENAAVEASRAGEAGKGFLAVVSSVQHLARETARATEDVGRRVEALRQAAAPGDDEPANRLDRPSRLLAARARE